MKKKHILALVLVVVMVLAMLPGCSGSKEHEAITIMDAQRDYSGLIELVHEKYPEINIEVIPYRGGNRSAYMKQQLETGSIPDIYSSTQAWDSDIQKEYLIDLSDYEITERYSPVRLEDYTVDGSLYLLPYDYTITGIICNESLLDRNDIEVPTSFAQLRDETVPALKTKGIKVSDSLLDLPGSAFQYFFNINSTGFINTVDGKSWCDAFSDTDTDTFASDNDSLATCAEYFRQWIDCGMLVADKESETYNGVIEDFTAGNTAFLVGTVQRFTQNEDGTGDQYCLLPFLSEDGTQNTYGVTPGCFYGLSKELEKSGNKQKLEDALHVLEVLSSNEGYLAIHGEISTNMCSITDFEVNEDSPYKEALEAVSKGHSMNMIYTGWDAYLVPFGEAVHDWIEGKGSAKEAYKILDDTKRSIQKEGVKTYATVTEELDTVQAAQLSGQMFMDASGADAALISYNVYSPDVPALMENSAGANGTVLTGNMTEEYITIFLPTSWYGTIQTIELKGSELKARAAEGCDTRGTGFKYPYVLMTADGEDISDDATYTVVVCGVNADEAETLEITDTGIVGLDAAKEYLLKVKEVSTKTLDESLVKEIETEEK